MKEQILRKCGEKAYNYISQFVDYNNPKLHVVSTTTAFNIQMNAPEDGAAIVNLKRVNDMRYINKFFEAINEKLVQNGIFIGCIETKELRKKRLLSKYMFGLNYVYYFFDFIFKRVFPKFLLTKKLYFFITAGRNRVVSRPEILGRLYSCGYEVIDECNIDSLFYFVVKKVDQPTFDTKPTYGPLVRLRRVGKNGKTIHVLKLRTMHPYAEYLQGYVYQKNSLQEGGKFKDDFRISGVGKFLRKFWLDELPMLINLLRGDLKLVGVRPLSFHYYNLYPKELQEKRVKSKPGLVPPFYAHMPKTFEEIVASEFRYLEDHEKHPFRTDVNVFFKACHNIIFKKARSN